MRKKSRAMDSEWALEVMHKAPYITVSFIDEEGKPYSLPLSLASDDDVNWYFHGASFLNTWMLSTRASPVPYHARLLFASRSLSLQLANASNMIRKAWK